MHKIVFLVGFMGAGKSSVGRALSHQLGWRFEDLDERIEEREGRKIGQIFREQGEAHFRRLEQSALLELLTAMEDSPPAVVALGGGTFVRPEPASLIRATGAPTIFLDVPCDELWQRCLGEDGERPLAGDEHQFRQLYEARLPLYLGATLRVENSGKSVEEVAGEIWNALGFAPPTGVRKES